MTEQNVFELTNDSEVLHRQVHPNHHPKGAPSKQAFLPNENDKNLLSTLRGRVSPAECYRRWTVDLGNSSVGTYGVSVGECTLADLSAIDDEAAISVPDHASVDFSHHETRGQKEQRARKIRAAATSRGILYDPPM